MNAPIDRLVNARSGHVTRGNPTMHSRLRVLPALVAGLLLLVGCAPQAAAPSASPTTTATSSTPTAAPAPVASRVVIGAENVEVVAEDDTLITSVRYFDPTASLVAALTAAFGADPVVSADPGGNETPPGTRYTWGGVAVVEREVEQSEPYNPATVLFVESAEESGVRIEVVGGYAVGDDTEAMAAEVSGAEGAAPEDVQRYTLPDGTPAVFIRADVTPIPPVVDEPGVESRSWAVGVIGSDAAPIERVVAPSPNWGA